MGTWNLAWKVLIGLRRLACLSKRDIQPSVLTVVDPKRKAISSITHVDDPVVACHSRSFPGGPYISHRRQPV